LNIARELKFSKKTPCQLVTVGSGEEGEEECTIRITSSKVDYLVHLEGELGEGVKKGEW